MKKLIFVCMLATLAACNTVEGAGKDISAGGSNVAGAAKETHEKMQENERYPNK